MPEATVIGTRHEVSFSLKNAPQITDEFGTASGIHGLRITYVNRMPTAIRFESGTNDYFMQPTDLDQPENWPGWVGDLVEQHRPSA